MEFPYRTDFLEVALADHPRAVVERRIAAGEKDGLLALAATGAEGGVLAARLARIGEADLAHERNRSAESPAGRPPLRETPLEWDAAENHVPGGFVGAGADGCSGWPAVPFLCFSS